MPKHPRFAITHDVTMRNLTYKHVISGRCEQVEVSLGYTHTKFHFPGPNC